MFQVKGILKLGYRGLTWAMFYFCTFSGYKVQRILDNISMNQIAKELNLFCKEVSYGEKNESDTFSDIFITVFDQLLQ